MSLAGKTLFITGASRGIGLAIALRAARDGANIAIAAKTASLIRGCRGPSFPPPQDRARRRQGFGTRLRHPLRGSGPAAVDPCAAKFGGIDICVNNASAIALCGTERQR